MSKKDPELGTPFIPRMLTLCLLVFIAYIYFNDYKKSQIVEPPSHTGKVKYLLSDEEEIKEIEFVGGKTTLSLNRSNVEELSKHLDQAFESDLDVFEIELDKYEPGNTDPDSASK